MNKLVSRSPVQRFKQGKKIVKAEEGAVAKWQRRIKSGINGIGSTFKGAFDMTFNPNNTQFGSQKTYNFFQAVPSRIMNSLVVENYTPENGGTTNNRLRNRQQNNQNIVKQNTFKTPELKGSKEAYLNRLQQQGFTAKKTPTNNGTLVKTKKTISAPVNNYYSKGFENRKDEIAKLGGVKAIQQMLKDAKFDIGKFGVDGRWGKDTERAYNEYLQKNAPTLPTSEQLIQQVTQNTPVIEEVPQAGIDTIQNQLTEMQKVVPITGTYTMKSVLPKLNRSDTRWAINDVLGKSAYNFTGAQRKALRQYLNGEQYNANDLTAFGDLSIFNKYKSTQSYKQGGNINKLPSRNIIERFKSQRNIKS